MMVRSALSMLMAIVAAGCSSAMSQSTPARTSIQVVVPASRSAAFDQTLAAFIDEQLAIDRAEPEGGIIATVPTIQNPEATARLEVVYRATILPAGDSSRVVLTASGRSVDAGALSEAVAGVRAEGQRTPITSGWRGEGVKAWRTLERIAARIQPTP